MSHGQEQSRIEPAFVLLFSVRLKRAFKGFAAPLPGMAPLPAETSQAWLDGLAPHADVYLLAHKSGVAVWKVATGTGAGFRRRTLDRPEIGRAHV